MKPFTNIAVLVFSLVALAHLARIFMNWEVLIAGIVIPNWLSGVAVVGAGVLAAMVWRESRK